MQKIDLQKQFEDLPTPAFSKDINIPPLSKEENVDKKWKVIRELIKMRISHREFMMWYEGFYLTKISNGIAEFSCTKAYQREWILNNHTRLLKDILFETTNQNLDISICVRGGGEKQKGSGKKKYEYHALENNEEMPIFREENNVEAQKQKALEQSQLNPDFSFENFVTGTGSRLAHAVSLAVTEQPGKAYNPVFFYGRTGVGKTHLMQAIGNEILNKNPHKKIIYCNSEQFLNEVIHAIRSGKTEDFRNNYRKLDVLIIDDIHFITSSPKTQEELFHTFNSLHLNKKQIIMASDRPPKDINGLTDRLRSRFEGGMICDIQPPDYETRMAILLKKVEEQDVQISQKILDLIALNINTNVRELEGAVTKVATMIKVLGVDMPEEEVLRILELDIENKRKNISPEKVINVVSEVFELNPKDIKGKKRTAYIAKARQTAMFILRETLEIPFEKAAKCVNRKDHTTVLHACEKIKAEMEKDRDLANKIDKCQYMLAE